MTDAQNSLADFHALSDAELEAFALSLPPLVAAFKVFDAMDVQTSPDVDLRALDAACARALNIPVTWTFNDHGDLNAWHITEFAPHPFEDVWISAFDAATGARIRFHGTPIPHFSTDPAATRLLEDEVKRIGLSDLYTLALFEIVNGVPWGYDVPVDEITPLVFATSEQKARAFLKVMPTREQIEAVKKHLPEGVRAADEWMEKHERGER